MQIAWAVSWCVCDNFIFGWEAMEFDCFLLIALLLHVHYLNLRVSWLTRYLTEHIAVRKNCTVNGTYTCAWIRVIKSRCRILWMCNARILRLIHAMNEWMTLDYWLCIDPIRRFMLLTTEIESWVWHLWGYQIMALALRSNPTSVGGGPAAKRPKYELTPSLQQALITVFFLTLVER